MKKITFLISILFVIVSVQAQDYQISFAGTGASTNLGTVTIVNQTQQKSISLLGSETLHLMAIVTGNAPILDNVNFPLHIYPNPSSDYFTIEFGTSKSGPVTIMLFDLMGREIGSLKQSLPSGNHSFRILGLKSGIYTIKIDHDNQSYSGKLISQGSSNSPVTITYIGNKEAAQETIKLKIATTERFWQYNTGDILSFTGTSGNLRSVITDIPIKSKIITFNFTASLPTVTTATATNIISTGAMLGGNLISDGGATVTERGIVFSNIANPTTIDTKVINGTDIGIFSTTISGLIPNTIYYVRAYATNSIGTVYGTQVSYKTQVVDPPYRAAMCVASSGYDKSSEVNISYIENKPIYLDTPAREGFNSLYLSIPADKTISIRDATGLDFTDFMKVVGSDNRDGYWNNLVYIKLGKFASIDPIGFSIIISDAHILFPPTVTTSGASGITATSVILGGSVTSDGKEPLTERGIIYSTTESATSSFTTINSGNGLGSFSSTVTELSSNTTYYARAFAANSQGTTYGPQVSFKTLSTNIPSPANLIVTTAAASDIAATSAVLGGSVTGNEKEPATEKGIVMSTSENPTITDSKVVNGTGTGSFSSTISGLTGNTTYYVRAYATNSKDTVYGAQVSFKTLLQYRMAMCVAKTGYDKSSEVNIPYFVEREIKLYSPVKDGFNFFFISIPANKTFEIKDEMGFDVSSDFKKIGEDNRESYWNNNIYRSNELYNTYYPRNFYLIISK